MEPERHGHRHERQHVKVLREWRLTLGDGEQAEVEADRVGEQERDDADDGVVGDVERDEQAVEAPYHRVPLGAASTSSTA